jgi:hypothetical protein
MLRKLQVRVAVGLLLAPAFVGAQNPPGTIRLHFDSDAHGTVPAFMRFESSPGLSSNWWRVEPDLNAFSTPNSVVQIDTAGHEGEYRFALSTQAKEFENGWVEAALRCASKTFPCRAGVALRYGDPENFLAAVYDFEKSAVSLIEIRKGKVEPLGSAPFASLQKVWTTVRLEARGADLSVQVSQRDVLKGTDPHPRKGSAGLLAEAGSRQGFDELLILPK